MVSIYGNSLVIWVVSTTKTMQTVHNGLIANLACSDIVIAIFCIPFQFYAALLQVIYFQKIFLIFNHSMCMTNPTIVYPVKMEYG